MAQHCRGLLPISGEVPGGLFFGVSTDQETRPVRLVRRSQPSRVGICFGAAPSLRSNGLIPGEFQFQVRVEPRRTHKTLSFCLTAATRLTFEVLRAPCLSEFRLASLRLAANPSLGRAGDGPHPTGHPWERQHALVDAPDVAYQAKAAVSFSRSPHTVA